MDAPTLPAAAHVAALRGLARINALSGVTDALWRALRAHAPLRRTLCGPAAAGAAPLRILDVASGAGDVALGLWHRATRAHAAVEIAGCDCSPRAVAFATTRAAAAGSAVRFVTCDVLHAGLPSGPFDFILCSLFLHHLATADVVRLLRDMAAAARVAVLVSDLRRSAAALAFTWLGTRVISRSPVVHADGARSVRAAFTRVELRELAARAGLAGATITRQWPFRMSLSWRRADARPAS
jgi:2-polyprenyl-3-methyl-5-hydroxy-6-metoxy-1,4-benzoquinol methylase